MGLSEEQIRDAEIVEVEYPDGTVHVLEGGRIITRGSSRPAFQRQSGASRPDH